MDVKLIRAEIKDSGLLKQMMEEFYTIEHLAFESGTAEKALGDILGSEDYGNIYIISAGSESAGYVVAANCFSLEFHGRFVLIDELYLSEAYRGKGVAMAAMQQIEELCRSRGIHAIRLEVAKTNVRARGVYGKAGFIKEERDLMTKWITE